MYGELVFMGPGWAAPAITTASTVDWGVTAAALGLVILLMGFSSWIRPGALPFNIRWLLLAAVVVADWIGVTKALWTMAPSGAGATQSVVSILVATSLAVVAHRVMVGRWA